MDQYWLILIAGSVLTLGALLLFLATLRHGLLANRWWPLLLTVIVWLIAMAVYSMWDADLRRDNSHIESERYGMQSRNAVPYGAGHSPGV